MVTETEPKSLIQVETWGAKDCAEIIARLVDGDKPRFGALHEKINGTRGRRAQYHNLKGANPILPAPYTGKSDYQTDILRRTHIRHRARVTENHPVARVTPPRDTAKQQELADTLEAVLNRIYDLAEERTGQNFQSLLSDGQDRDCYGILHWVKANSIWPHFPEASELDALPDDPKEAAAYASEPNDAGKYVETDASRQSRDKHAKARAGAPWHIEVVDPTECGFIEDITSANGFGIFVRVKDVGFLDYNTALLQDTGHVISLNQADKKVLVGVETSRPKEGDSSSAGSWGPIALKVGYVWNRTECYELVQGTIGGEHTDWGLVRSFEHPYEMPPFAIAYGHRNQHPDPVQAYEPVLEGLYRIKPGYDFVMALNEIIAQSIALPVWWIERQDGTPRLDERGKPIVLSRDSVRAAELQPGEKLVKAEFDLNPAFVALMQLRQEELKEAAPSVGVAEVSATTQAWALLLQQQQESIEPKQIVVEQERAIRTMWRNMALVMSKNADEGGFGQPVVVYGKTKDGKLQGDTVIGIDPADIPTLEVDAEINPRSAAEVITRTEHGLKLLESRVITLPEFKADYQMVENPQDDVKQNIAWWTAVDYLQPGIIKQELAKKYAAYVVMGPNGAFIGMDGQQMTPEQVLQANQQQPIPTAAPQASVGAMPTVQTGGGQPMGGPVGMGTSPGPLPSLSVPTQVTQPGIPAGAAR